MKKSLSPDTIVDAAFEVLDEAGVDGLTVRAVAERLGVKAPALYWHVRNKKDMLDEMGTQVWRGVAEQATWTSAADWREALGAYARAARRALLAHRDGARLFGVTFMTDAGVLQAHEEGLAWMREQGFSVQAATDAGALLTSFVIGHCIEEQERTEAPDDRYTLATRNKRIAADTHPLVAASGVVITGADTDARFTRMLRTVLDGIAQTRAPSDPPASETAGGSGQLPTPGR